MELKVREPRLVREYGKGYTISFTVDARCTETAKQLVDELRESDLKMDVREWRDHRSLSANAYFHVLCGKLAVKLGIGEDEVKRNLVLNYGAQARDKDGDPIWINLPRGIEPEQLGVKYAKWFNVTEVRQNKHDCYIVFAETHTYDTKQFSRLLDGAVREAKEQGIETLTPETLKSMMVEYDKQKNKGTGDNAGGQEKSL